MKFKCQANRQIVYLTYFHGELFPQKLNYVGRNEFAFHELKYLAKKKQRKMP